MKKKHDKKLLKRAVSAVLAYTIMFTSLPPVKIDLPELGIHWTFFENIHSALFDRDAISAKADDVTYATMTVDNFENERNDTYSVSITGDIRTVYINKPEQLLEYSIAYNTFPTHNHDTDIIFFSLSQNGAIWDLVGEITSNFKAANTTLNGTTASGYLFGSYTNAATSYAEIPEDGDTPAVPASTVSDRTFTIDTSFRNVALTFAANNAGGYFGELNNNATGATVTFDGGVSDVSANLNDGTNTLIKANYNGKSDLGGVAYKYKANALENSFVVGNTYIYVNGNIKNFGGVCSVVDDSTSAAYISIHDFYTRQPKTATTSGGLIYNSNSSFIDVSGYVRVAGGMQGGLIYSMPKGVLRLAGTTNLSGVSSTVGLIVNDRTNGLIYSKGTGNDDGTGASGDCRRKPARAGLRRGTGSGMDRSCL